MSILILKILHPIQAASWDSYPGAIWYPPPLSPLAILNKDLMIKHAKKYKVYIKSYPQVLSLSFCMRFMCK